MAFREKKSQRKPVLMLSTSEAAGIVNVRTAAGIVKPKPLCIAAYNRYMGGVDISDRKVYHVAAERSSRRYWKKIFFNIMDLSLLNAYELYRANTDHPVSRYDFMCDIVVGLCASGEAAVVPDLQHLPAASAWETRAGMCGLLRPSAWHPQAKFVLLRCM